MSYLKLVNHPIKWLFPVKNKVVDWERVGFDPAVVSRLAKQGNVDGDFITLLPISDENKLLDAVDAGGKNIIDAVNTNSNPGDTAEIITDEESEALKSLI